MRQMVKCVVWVLGLAIFGVPAEAATPLTAGERDAVEKINVVFRRAIEQVRPAVVNIQVRASDDPDAYYRDRGEGSGCIIDPAGYVITNNHVVENMEHVEVVLADHRRFVATAVYLDPDTDLAIVKIDPKGEKLPFATFGDSDKALVGDFVMAIGSPFGLEQTVTMGIISFKGRETAILDTWGFEDFIQTDADINRGNSGGPLVNLYGEIVGINSNIYSPTGTSTGYGFAIPSNLAKDVADQLIAHQVVKRGWLGVSMSMTGLDETHDRLNQSDPNRMPRHRGKMVREMQAFFATIPKELEGVLIRGVMEDTPASAAGILENDVVLSVNDRKVVVGSELRNYVATLRPGEVVRCAIWRGGETIKLDVTLGDRDVAKRKDAEEKELASRSQNPFHYRHPQLPWIEPGVPEWNPSHPPVKLGVELRPLTPDLAWTYGYDDHFVGVIITKVLKGSLADRNGLKAGDIITHIDGVPVYTVREAQYLVSKADTVDEGMVLRVRNHGGVEDRLIRQESR